MKKTILLLALFIATLSSAQIFSGKGDQKLQIGADLQSGASGMNATFDYGIGENISVGLTAAYALGTASDIEKDFDERAHIRLRFNANIGNVINIDPNFDLYPGIGFSNKNFGGHLGARYFFTDGFGVFSEMAIPFAKYSTDKLTPAEDLYNQFTASVGMSFNL